jgi:hypothetical protein
MANVKKPLSDDRIVVLETEVYPRAAFTLQLKQQQQTNKKPRREMGAGFRLSLLRMLSGE